MPPAMLSARSVSREAGPSLTLGQGLALPLPALADGIPQDTLPLRKGTQCGAWCRWGAAGHGHPALHCCFQTWCVLPLEMPAAGTAHGADQCWSHLFTIPSGLSEPLRCRRATLPTSPNALFLFLSLLQAFTLKPSEEPQNCTIRHLTQLQFR